MGHTILTILTGEWQTPGGHRAVFAYREGTNDWNTISSTMAPHDEYRTAGLRLGGWALDLGAFVGSVAVGLALDNPGLHVLAVEPVPPNVELIERNAELNGVGHLISAVQGAVGPPGVDFTTVRYGYRGEPNLEHHYGVGNTSLVYEYGGEHEHEEVIVPVLRLADCQEFAFAKIDCEGGEWGFFDGPLGRLARIHGEWHPVNGHTRADLLALLGTTHEVTFSGPEAGPGGFEAVRR